MGKNREKKVASEHGSEEMSAEPIRVMCAINAARCDSLGSWRLVLEIPAQDGPKVAALALNTEKVFEAHFFVQSESKEADTI